MTDPQDEYREEYRAWVEERAKAAAEDIESLVWSEPYGTPVGSSEQYAEIIARHFLGPQ